MFVGPGVSRFVLAVVLGLLLSGRAAFAGAFLSEPGEWQVIHSTSATTSRSAYAIDGSREAADQYRKFETSWWTEYGLTRDVTLILNPALRDVSLQSGAAIYNGRGLSSLEVGARWRLPLKPFDFAGETVSFQATTRVAGRTDPLLPLENRPRTELRLGYGSAARVNGKSGFTDWSVAWVKRHEPGADEIHVDHTVGWWRTPKRMLLAQTFMTYYPASSLQRAGWQNKVQWSVVHKLDDAWSLQLGSFVSRGGRLTRREQGSVMALWRRF